MILAVALHYRIKLSWGSTSMSPSADSHINKSPRIITRWNKVEPSWNHAELKLMCVYMEKKKTQRGLNLYRVFLNGGMFLFYLLYTVWIYFVYFIYCWGFLILSCFPLCKMCISGCLCAKWCVSACKIQLLKAIPGWVSKGRADQGTCNAKHSPSKVQATVSTARC